MIDAARRLAGRLRRLPDRLLHGWRRRDARERLRAAGAPATVLMVCYGNICRSPYAAGALRRLISGPLGDGVHITSAGFVGPHRASPADAVTAAAARGVDLTGHRSRLLTAQAIAAARLIVVMEPWQAGALVAMHGRPAGEVLVLGDLDPAPIDMRGIVDPVERPPAVYAASYDRIDRCLRELVAVTWAAAESPGA